MALTYNLGDRVKMPRRIVTKKKKKTGRMFFEASTVSSNMSLKDLMGVIFTSAESYKEIATILLEWIKSRSDQENRGRVRWVTTSEMSNYINERLMPRRRSAAYAVIKNYLVPLGILEYRPSESKYILSRDFAGALKRLAEAYMKWAS